MAMNFAPLNCPCQGASSESKKNLPGFFFILEKIAKNHKIHIFWLPQQKMGFNGRKLFTIPEFN
jgi:hypothetical protein